MPAIYGHASQVRCFLFRTTSQFTMIQRALFDQEARSKATLERTPDQQTGLNHLRCIPVHDWAPCLCSLTNCDLFD